MTRMKKTLVNKLKMRFVNVLIVIILIIGGGAVQRDRQKRKLRLWV